MASTEKPELVQTYLDKSPHNTAADDELKYMFPPSEVGIPLTKLQWSLTFVGYVCSPMRLAYALQLILTLSTFDIA